MSPFIVVIFVGIPQSARCSESQTLLILRTFESPDATKVSAAVSSIDVEPALLVFSLNVP